MSAPANRPGLDALAYRAGTYATFVRTMRARLGAALPALTTRELDDPSNALLDGWALVADVLTFYQERIANEGYVRTASEKRSLVELANMVGYRPRPGVAASVYLAYTLEKGAAVTLAPGNKVQSVPGPGETAQTYETAGALDARDGWNALGVRATRPQEPNGSAPFYLSGVTTNLKPNDLLLFARNGTQQGAGLPEHRFVRVAAVEAQPAQNRTKIALQGEGLVWEAATTLLAVRSPLSATPSSAASAPPGEAAIEPEKPAVAPEAAPTLLDRIAAVEEPLLRRASVPPRSPQRLVRTASQTFGQNLDVLPQLFDALHANGAARVYAALANTPQTVQPLLEVYAFRVHAAPYGHNAPAPPRAFVRGNVEAVEYEPADWRLEDADGDPLELSLDARYDRIAPGSFVGIRTFPNDEPELFAVAETRERSRRDYGLAATTTVLRLNAGYFTEPGEQHSLAPLRDVDVFAQSELLKLAEVPIETDIPEDPAAAPTILELDGIYDGLTPGRWAIVAGKRTDLPGVADAELVMIAATEHRTNPAIPGDAVHTFLTLSTRLAYRYERSSVTISGNVVRATHGETRTETIGSGDASQARQAFTLKAKPLTFLSSPTQSGTQSTLTVRVNGVRWREAADLNSLGPNDRAYVTATSDAGTSVIFGDGVHGARLPTAAENVTATYRTGIGAPGNLDPGKISLLMSRPLGVKGVSNPRAASGGADSESRDDIRRNVSTALLALDRLVSLDDYANFARTFAGIAKAAVVSIGSGAGSTVYLTLAGPGNAAIDAGGDLATNLAAALRKLGDSRQAFALGSFERVILVIGASVDLSPDALWETVEPAIRSALVAEFGFDARDFGRPAYKSEAIAAIQGVAGVVEVTLDLFAGITAATLDRLATFDEQPVVEDVIAPKPARSGGDAIAPAQLVALDPSVRDTILLRKRAGGAAV